MLLTTPPTISEVAQAAANVSDGTLAGALVEPWPRGRSHHAFMLTTAAGQFVLRAHKQEHPGRMRRFVRVAQLLALNEVPAPGVRWWDLDARHLPHAFYIQEFLPGEDAARALAELSACDGAAVGAEIGAGLRRLHAIEHEDTPTPWATEFDDRIRIRAAECVELGALSGSENRRVLEYYEERRDTLTDVKRRLTHDDLTLANILLERRVDGWHLAAFLDFERTRGLDPLLDLARLHALVFDACPAMRAPFEAAYGEIAVPDDEREARLELYAVYLLVWGVPWSRGAGLATRERDYRHRLQAWLER
ncbi:MAG: aminoglycoside phosphotransferase family protein [Chloroflexi bacterium]|nr:aminoglycoside phosphotransferase family protein [Chloroflexota bacterium]